MASEVTPPPCVLGETVFLYTITKRNPCHLVPAQSFHEKNVLQAVESIGNVFFDGVMFLAVPRTFFTQKLETIPTGSERMVAMDNEIINNITHVAGK